MSAAVDTISFAEAIFGLNTDYWKAISHPKFLFFARFVTTTNLDTKPITVAIKSVDRPKFNFNVQVLNQYNKRRLVQTHQDHGEVRMVIHDIVDHRIHDFFQKYWEFYYAQGTYSHDESNKSIWGQDITTPDMLDNEKMGYLPPASANSSFLDHVEIYSLYGGKYNRWDLINPKLKDYSPDGYDHHAMVETNEISLIIEFETVIFSKIQQTIGSGADSGGGAGGGGVVSLGGLDMVSDAFQNPADSGDGGSSAGAQSPQSLSSRMMPASIATKNKQKQITQPVSNVRTAQRILPEQPELIKQAQSLSSRSAAPQRMSPHSTSSIINDGSVTVTDPTTMYAVPNKVPLPNPYSNDIDIGAVTFGTVPSIQTSTIKNISGTMLDVNSGRIGGTPYARSIATTLLYYPNLSGQTIIKSKDGISFSDNALGVLNISRDSGSQLGKKLSSRPASATNGLIDWTNL